MCCPKSPQRLDQPPHLRVGARLHNGGRRQAGPHSRSRIFKSSGSFCRFHPRRHSLFPEGGFDQEGRFVNVGQIDPQSMSACFRQRVVAFFLQRRLLSERLGGSMLEWCHVATLPTIGKPPGADGHHGKLSFGADQLYHSLSLLTSMQTSSPMRFRQ